MSAHVDVVTYRLALHQLEQARRAVDVAHAAAETARVAYARHLWLADGRAACEHPDGYRLVVVDLPAQFPDGPPEAACPRCWAIARAALGA